MSHVKISLKRKMVVLAFLALQISSFAPAAADTMQNPSSVDITWNGGQPTDESGRLSMCQSSAVYLYPVLEFDDGEIISGTCWVINSGFSFIYKRNPNGALDEDFKPLTFEGYIDAPIKSNDGNSFFFSFNNYQNRNFFLASFLKDGKPSQSFNNGGRLSFSDPISLLALAEDSIYIFESDRHLYRYSLGGELIPQFDYSPTGGENFIDVQACANGSKFVLTNSVIWYRELNGSRADFFLTQLGPNGEAISKSRILEKVFSATLACDSKSRPVVAFENLSGDLTVTIGLKRYVGLDLDLNFGVLGTFVLGNPYSGICSQCPIPIFSVEALNNGKLFGFVNSRGGLPDKFFILTEEGILDTKVGYLDVPTRLNCSEYYCYYPSSVSYSGGKLYVAKPNNKNSEIVRLDFSGLAESRPAAPRITLSGVASNSALVAFDVPLNEVGPAISAYQYSIDDGLTWLSNVPAQITSPLVISGLTNGVTYSVKIRAVNSVGSGAESNAVSVKPVAPASAPTISGVVAGNGQATLSITAPSQINDSSLSGYDYSTNNGSTWLHFASATGPFTISGLTNATDYQVKVRAVNSADAGEASTAVTVRPTRLVPAKPVIASVVGGNASATVNITTPSDVTAQSITGYQYSINRGATYQNAPVSNGTFTINGLTNGVLTSVQVRATNFNGNSLASIAKTVVPATTPASPSITTITPSAGALSIAFTAPNTGGSAITSYQYSLDGGTTWVVPKTAVKTSPIKIAGLPNGTSYQVKIRAVNGKGIGSASDAASASTPVLVPSAPVTTSIAKTSTTFIVDVTAPTNNGGGEIANYAYSIDYGKTWTIVSPASNSTRIVIAGLTPNKLYPVQIAAINSAGRGVASAKYNAVTLR